MITADQIRAARALKGWSQAELAQHANLATPSVANIELGKQKPSADTLEKIQLAFLLAGIEFTARGVEKKTADERLTLVTQNDRPGKNIYVSLLEDVFTVLQRSNANKEMLYFCTSDIVSPPDVVDMLQKMRDAGIKMRHLISDRDKFLMAPLNEYRCFPDSLFINRVSMVYDTRYAVCLDAHYDRAEPGAFVIFNDDNVALAQRNIFETLWATLPMPTETQATRKFR